MSEPQVAQLDPLLDRLEASISLLSDSGAPLERLVVAHEEAVRLAETATRLLAELEAWASAREGELASAAPRE